jgi:hypothetical protein
MDLFVGNLPEDATVAEVDVLFLSFRPMRLKLERGGYAVATVIPDRLALRAAQQLRGQSLRGHAVEVREYFRRDAANERRGRQHRMRPWPGPERRRRERRAIA